MTPSWNPFGLRVALVLGGGAARGLAHLGVLRALVREGIPIDMIVGTSMGAILGGAFAADRDIAALERRVRQVLSSEQFRRNRLSFLRESKQQRGGLLYSVANLVRRGIVYGVSTMRPSFLSAEEFADSIAAVIPRQDIENLPTPFAAVALDIDNAQEVVMRTGSLLEASRASAAIPGILPPVRRKGRTLVDGGWIDKVPVLPAFHMGADVVIAVDITAELGDAGDNSRAVDIMMRANLIRDTRLVQINLQLADLVIEPDVKRIHWADFGAVDVCVDAGDAAATTMAPRIRELLRHERWKLRLRPRIGRRFAERFFDGDGARVRYD